MELTQARVRELFDYRDGRIFNRIDRRLVKAGKEVGLSSQSDGYKQVCFDGKTYLVHRIVFLWHHGWLPKFLDHIDLNKQNNRIENLRPASHSQNMANRSAWGNKTGYKGVYYIPSRNKFQASLRINKKLIHLGEYGTAEEAHAAYLSAAEKIHGDFFRAI